jgi:altronate dehydratase large subunit
MEFKGYKRADGRYGVRNHVLAVSSVSCANGVVDALGRIFPDIVTVQHAYGCGYGPDDWGTSFTMLSGLANHPNVGAVLAIGLGCELLKAEHLVDAVKGKPAEALVIQQMGSAAATKRGIDIIEGFIRQLAGQQRETAPLCELLVGLKCGGSDAFSGVTANPSLGVAADMLVGEGAAVVMGEVTEMIGTDHILKGRCDSPELGEKLQKLILGHEKYVKDALGELAGMVIAPGNIDGGLSSITEKSLGCNAKSGSTPIREVVDYSARPTRKGLIIMDTPGYDIDAMAGMAGGGTQVIVFTTGRGTPVGFPAVPVIKVSSNSTTFHNMQGDIDVNAGSILDAGKTVKDVGREIFECIVRAAGGGLTSAEINKSSVFNCLKKGATF